MSWAPHVTVAAVIERAGRFLVVEEMSADRRVYNQPAGHLEDGESLIEAVVRETLEETGWHFEPTALVGCYRWVHPRTRDTFLRFCFTGTAARREEQRPLDPDIVATHWLSEGELAADPLRLRSPLVMRCIEDYRRGARYPLDLYADVASSSPL